MVLDKLPPESLPIVEQFVNFLQAQIAKTQEHQTTEQISGLADCGKMLISTLAN